MLYSSLYSLLEDTATNLPFNVEFAHGRGSDINIFSSNNESFLIWLSPLKSSGVFPNQGNRLFRNWTIELAFYKGDTIDGTNEDTLAILETVDKVVLKYILDLNDSIQSNTDIGDDVTITNYSQEPFIKVTKNILSGHLATFNINLPDDFRYCQ